MDDFPRPHLLQLCWGKAASSQGDYHPVLLHMLDVAAVALEMLELPALQARARLLLHPQVGRAITPTQIALLVSLHDLGKISPGFQGKVPSLAEPLRAAGLPFSPLSHTDHSRVGAAVLVDELEVMGLELDVADAAARAVVSHHGSVPSGEPLAPTEHGGPRWAALRRSAVEQLTELLPATPLKKLDVVSDAWVALLAGMTSVADWIGSDTDFFPYDSTSAADLDYLFRARERARGALDCLGWTGWQPPQHVRSFEELFQFRPRPLQRTVAAAATTARLLVLEAPTGSGKTEAALVAAEQWTVEGGGAGLFVALPTQATSNQMVGRVASFLSRRFPEARVNLHLAHGGAGLDPTYRSLRARSVDGPGNGVQGVVADSWFAARKRPLLAPFGVGTIDQALLAVLQCRHGLVRLYGLSGKAIVIDEVHAYDAFMSEVLNRLLAWLRRLDCRVILLSATLAEPQRRALLQAWGVSLERDLTGPTYPRLTAVDDLGQTVVYTIPPPPSHSVELAWGPASEECEAVARQLIEQIESGGCAAWICNTVSRAQQAAATLARLGWELRDTTVFHARLPAAVRKAREQAVLSLFGPTGDRPHRHVVVATQVVEQSLDLDFDVMFTELAPVDLLLQRAGRLWRHQRSRPQHISGPVLTILRPGTHHGSVPAFGPSAFVYHAHLLLRSWLVLRDRNRWTIPEDVPGLVASVYEPRAAPSGPLGDAWTRTAAELEHHRRMQRSASSRDLLPMPSPDGEFLGQLRVSLDDDLDGGRSVGHTARTRDIGATVRLICLHQDVDGMVRLSVGGSVVDLAVRPDRATVASLLGRAVTVSHPAWVSRLCAFPLPAGWSRVGALRGVRPVLFNPRGRAEVGGRALLLHPHLGLCLDPSDKLAHVPYPESEA